MQRRVRIECPNGQTKDMVITEVASGAMIPFVESVVWTTKFNEPTPTAVITVMLTQANMLADATILGQCPHCGHTSPLRPTTPATQRAPQ